MKQYEKDMEPAFIKIGRYLYDFGGMEVALNDCIAKGLGINTYQSETVSALLSINAKSRLMKEIIIVQTRDDDWKQKRIRLMDKIDRAAGDRNIVAHSVFFPEYDGLMFANRRVRTGVDQPDTGIVYWKENEYESKIDKLERIKDSLEELATDLTQVRIYPMALMEAADSVAAMVTLSPGPTGSSASLSISSTSDPWAGISMAPPNPLPEASKDTLIGPTGPSQPAESSKPTEPIRRTGPAGPK